MTKLHAPLPRGWWEKGDILSGWNKVAKILFHSCLGTNSPFTKTAFEMLTLMQRQCGRSVELPLMQTNTSRAGREKQICSFNVNSDETKTTPLLPFAIASKVLFRKRSSNSDFCFSIYLWGLVTQTIKQQLCQTHQWHFSSACMSDINSHQWLQESTAKSFANYGWNLRKRVHFPAQIGSSWVQCQMSSS